MVDCKSPQAGQPVAPNQPAIRSTKGKSQAKNLAKAKKASGKPKRKKKPGHFWTRPKRHRVQPATVTWKIKDPKVREATGYPRSSTQSSTMSIRRDAVERDFGLRPQAGLRAIVRPSVPIEQIEAAEPSPAETNFSFNTAQSTQSMPVRKPSHALAVQAHDNRGDDRSPTISPTNAHKEFPPPSNNKPPKRRHSNESQKSNDGENLTLPSHFPPCPIDRPEPRDIAHWRDGCRAVQRPDGTVNSHDVVMWSMTRKGGVANPWPKLDEGLKAIEDMRKDMIDPAEILRRQREEEEAARAKEERRQANKRRYRPRGQIDKERAKRRAALATKQAQENLEESGSANVQKEDAGGIQEPQAKELMKEADL